MAAQLFKSRPRLRVAAMPMGMTPMKTSLARNLAFLLSALVSSSCSSPSEPSENENGISDNSDTEADSGVEPEAGPSGCHDPAAPCPSGSYCADDGTCRTCWQGFADREAYGVSQYPWTLAVGDIDADGHLDVVTGHYDAYSLDITYGTVDGLGVRKTYPLHYPARDVALGDLDKDGRLDIFASAIDAIDELWWNGERFSRRSIPLDFYSGALRVADVDGDGWLDFVLGEYANWSVVVYYNGPKRAVEKTYAYDVDHKPGDLALGDINRDGWIDAVTTNTDANKLTVVMPVARASYEKGGTFATGRKPSGLAIADIDGDEWLDVVVANGGSNDVSVLLSQPKNGRWNGFADQLRYPVDTAPIAVAVGDVNGDGFADIVAVNERPDTPAGSVSVLLQRRNEDGAFDGFEEQQLYPVGSRPLDVALADFDGDGWLDIVTADLGSHHLSLLRSKVAPECAKP